MSDFSYTINGVVPKLTEDVSLKRVRTETNDGDAIRVATTGPGTDLSPIEESLGTTTDTSSDPTVIGLLKSIASKLQ